MNEIFACPYNLSLTADRPQSTDAQDVELVEVCRATQQQRIQASHVIPDLADSGISIVRLFI